MFKIRAALTEAEQHASNEKETCISDSLLTSLQTRNISYREALKTWITAKYPSIESVLGSVEPIRDLYGVRAEWKGVVCITDVDESAKLSELDVCQTD